MVLVLQSGARAAARAPGHKSGSQRRFRRTFSRLDGGLDGLIIDAQYMYEVECLVIAHAKDGCVAPSNVLASY